MLLLFFLLFFFPSNYILNHSVGHEKDIIVTLIDYWGIQGYIAFIIIIIIIIISILKHRLCILQVINQNICFSAETRKISEFFICKFPFDF